MCKQTQGPKGSELLFKMTFNTLVGKSGLKERCTSNKAFQYCLFRNNNNFQDFVCLLKPTESVDAESMYLVNVTLE